MTSIRLPKDRKTLLLLCTTLIWMGVIFFFSSQPADESSKVSGFVAEQILAVINSVFGRETAAVINRFFFENALIIRKAGHVTEYLILGLLMSAFLRRVMSNKFFLTAVIICSLYAVSDEIHQAFVPGRVPTAIDVLIDSVSAAIGAIVIFLSARKRSMR
ncbi:MAG TPA: VanZ family protein [Clostridiaceae bacterium]|nr:VanZ family protein [Clostridiaceae bacterium]